MRFSDKATLSIAEAVQAVIEGLQDADLDESRMSEFHAMMKDGKSAAEIAKALKLDVKTVKTLMSEDTQPTELEAVTEAKVKKLSSKEEAAVLKLISKTKTTKEAAAKVAKEMKISDKEASAVVKMVMSQYESAEVAEDVVESVVISEEDKQAKYQAFFKKAMKKFGIDDITDLKGDKKKEFFDYVDDNYEAEGEVDEVAEPEAEGEKKFKALHSVKVSEETTEVDEAAKENWIDGVKYQKEKKKKGFNKADWEWNSSKQLYKRVNESVVLDENQVMSARFKVGDMPNSDLFTSIEKLKTAKKKAEAQKPKVSDLTLVKSLNDVIREIDKTIKDAEKVQATASNAIAKVAPSIKRTFELLSRKKYLVNSTEVEGDTIAEAATKVIVSVELWNGKKMKKSFKKQSAAEAFIKKMQDEEDVRGYNMYAEGLDELHAEAIVEGASDKIAKQMVVLNTKIDQIRGDIQSTKAAHRDNDIDNAKFKKLDNEHNKRLSKAEAELDKLFARFKSVKESIDLDELHCDAVELDEAFKRIPGNMINGELPRAAMDLESVLRGLKAGNDFDEKAFNKVLAALNNVKKSAKSFKSADDVTMPYQYRADPRYKKESAELVGEELSETMTASVELLEAKPSTVIVLRMPMELFNKAGQTFRATAPEKHKTTVVAASNDRYFAIAGEPKDLEKMLKTDPLLKGKVDVDAVMATAVKFTGKETFFRQKGANFKN